MVGRAVGAPVAVSHLAAAIMARIVRRDINAGALSEPLLRRLQEVAAATGRDQDPVEALRLDMRRARVNAATLTDHYIPEAARRLGCDWAGDRVSFAEVSIRTARLQAILRNIGSGWSADDDGARDGPAVLMLVPEGDQHTLGAMIATARLRRMGVSVCLRPGIGRAALRDLLVQRGFDAAMISVACTQRLELCADLVKTLKDVSGGGLAVAVGGAVLLKDKDAVPCIGADIMTNDLNAALHALGLTGSAARAVSRV